MSASLFPILRSFFREIGHFAHLFSGHVMFVAIIFTVVTLFIADFIGIERSAEFAVEAVCRRVVIVFTAIFAARLLIHGMNRVVSTGNRLLEIGQSSFKDIVFIAMRLGLNFRFFNIARENKTEGGIVEEFRGIIKAIRTRFGGNDDIGEFPIR